MIGFEENLTWLQRVQIRLEQINYEDQMNLERVKPLILVWQLSLMNGSAKAIALAQEGVSLWVKDLWGMEATVFFDQKNQSVHAKHPLGPAVSFYAKDLNLGDL